MQWFGVTPPLSVSGPFELLINLAVEGGAPAPLGMVFFDPDGLWRDALAGFSLVERRACIAVAFEDECLVAAARLSMGGGVLLPPSQLRVSAACRAARDASSLPSWIADPELVAEVGGSEDGLRIRLHPVHLWDAMVGLRGQLEVLAQLAEALERPAIIDAGPALVVSGVNRAAVERAWEDLDRRWRWASGRRFLTIDGEEYEESGVHDADQRWPVATWPASRMVGRWRIDETDPAFPWKLEMVGQGEIDSESVANRIDLERATADVVRIQGVPASDLEREGSPGAVVVEALARDADRRGQILWIPGVSRNAAVLIRHWGVDVWIDGPAVS